MLLHSLLCSIMLEIPQKGGSSFQENWWELCVEAEPLYVSQVAACLVHAITDIFNVNKTL